MTHNPHFPLEILLEIIQCTCSAIFHNVDRRFMRPCLERAVNLRLVNSEAPISVLPLLNNCYVHAQANKVSPYVPTVYSDV